MDTPHNASEVERSSSHFYTLRFGVVGAIFGLIMALAASVIASGESANSLSFTHVFRDEPLLWILYLGAAALTISAALAGRYLDRAIDSSQILRQQSEHLERGISTRNDGMDQAVKISRGFTQGSDLEELLNRAVTLIHDGYALEGVRTYLVDPRGYNLILSSASTRLKTLETIGPQQISLSHGSVVGTAAVEKKIVAIASPSNDLKIGPDIDSLTGVTQLAIPMQVGEKLIGVLDLYDSGQGNLTAEIIPALAVIADQLAITIEHTRLVAIANQARDDVSTQARRMVRRGWEDYLNAIDRRETLDFTFEADTINLLDKGQSLGTDSASLIVPITVTGEQIGSIRVQESGDKEWTPDEIHLAEEVARQVGQQAENLRLLSEADYYRDEAENAARRLTKQGWIAYLESAGKRYRGYEYRQGEVEPFADRAEISGDEKTIMRQSLTVRGESIGTVELALDDEADEETRELVAAVTDQLSEHLENLRLTDQTQRALSRTEDQAKRLVALNELGQEIAAASTEEDVLQIAAEKTGTIIRADHINLALLNESDDFMEINSYDGTNGLTRIGDLHAVKDSALGIAIEQNRVIVLNDTGIADRNAGSLNDESVIVAPMRAGGRVIGALSVGCGERGAYTSQDAGFLLQVASLVASTIESRRLFAETERRARDLALINRVARAVSQELELDHLLETVYAQIEEAMHPDAFYIGLFDPETQLVDYPIMVESGNRNRQFGLNLYPESSSYTVIHSGEPVLSNLTAEQVAAFESELPPVIVGERHDLVPASLIYVPLRVGQRVSGLLSIQSYTYNAYRPSDVALLGGIANYVAIALDNARLFQHVQSRARREQILRQVTARVRRTEDVDEVLETAAREISRALGRRAYVHLDHDENDEPVEPPEDTHDGSG
ncbi:MAG: GAF domain-containing protein [Candidatus Promineifilaceae bacterium]